MKWQYKIACLCLLLFPTYFTWHLLNYFDIKHDLKNNDVERTNELLEKFRNLRGYKGFGEYLAEKIGNSPSGEGTLEKTKQLRRKNLLMDKRYGDKDTEVKDKNVKVLNNHYVQMQNKSGRLGNWMFRYAHAFSVAKKLNYKCIIRSKHPLTTFFDIPNVSDMPLDNLLVVKQSQWDRQTRQDYSDYLSHNLTFIGTYERFPYFINYSKEIKDIYKVKPKYLEQAQTFIDANTPKKRTLIGIHVRRGDFQKSKSLERGAVTADQEYFIKAMSYYRHLYSDAIFIVVSDDHLWCQQNIVGPDVRYSLFTEAIVDFAIVTLCDHTIMSVGTFGWWAGWLAGGTVVYLADYPIPGSLLEKRVMHGRENFYFPDWIPISNGNRTY